MANSEKKKILSVVSVVFVFVCCIGTSFSSTIQLYKNEITRRNSALTGWFDPDSFLMKLGEPLYYIVSFCVAAHGAARMLSTNFPIFRSLFDYLGIGFSFPLGQVPTEMLTARDVRNRDQRLLDFVDGRVKAAIHEYENEVKKKK